MEDHRQKRFDGGTPLKGNDSWPFGEWVINVRHDGHDPSIFIWGRFQLPVCLQRCCSQARMANHRKFGEKQIILFCSIGYGFPKGSVSDMSIE